MRRKGRGRREIQAGEVGENAVEVIYVKTSNTLPRAGENPGRIWTASVPAPRGAGDDQPSVLVRGCAAQRGMNDAGGNLVKGALDVDR